MFFDWKSLSNGIGGQASHIFRWSFVLSTLLCIISLNIFIFLFNEHAKSRQVFARQEEGQKIKEIRTLAEQIVVYWWGLGVGEENRLIDSCLLRRKMPYTTSYFRKRFYLAIITRMLHKMSYIST